MINVIASIHIKEGNIQKFISIFKSNMPSVLQEKGCIEYVPTIDFPAALQQELNQNVVTIIEKWVNLEALQAHLVSPHMLVYKEQVKYIVEKIYLKILTEV
jgi:quinol monooxygenase YgiN